jgi:hypothetical protein
MGDHYAALWIPWLLVGTVAAVAALAKRRGAPVARRWTTAAGILCAIFLIAFNPLHPLHYLHPYYHDLAAARRAIGCVPKDASMATYDEWFSAVAAQRPRATIDRADGVEYLVYARDFSSDPNQARLWPQIQAEVARGTYRIACRYDDVVTYQVVNAR